MNKTHIWWIRRDIRLQDNQTLMAAIKEADQFIPLFIIEPELMSNAAPRRRSFLLSALSDLDQNLRERGSHLIIRSGPAKNAFHGLMEELDGALIFAHEDFSPFARARDDEIMKEFDLNLTPGVLLRHPRAIVKDDGDPYVVYTPYKNKWYQEPIPTPADCIPTPDLLPPLPENIETQTLPVAEKTVSEFPGTSYEAQKRLTNFITNDIHMYKSRRDRLDLAGTSKLSPYLRFGLISVREAFAKAQIAYIQSKNDQDRIEIRTWMDELVWREFYTAILYHYPRVMHGAFREDYKTILWRDSPKDLLAWQQGQTGYPIVDACMRQLLNTGWMHNRGRMIVASFLTKDLLINWQEGESWFMVNLVDGDPAANNGGWQWSAGTGTDAAPYFRIFNPVLQGQKFDPDGKYIAKWVPELRKLPVTYRHQPWKINKQEAKEYNFKLGENYPHRIVDHKFARERTLDAYKSARSG